MEAEMAQHEEGQQYQLRHTRPNRRVRTRMPGGVGGGRETAPLSRLLICFKSNLNLAVRATLHKRLAIPYPHLSNEEKRK